MTRKEILIAVVLTFITICAWELFNVLHARAQVEIPQKTQELMKPISPDFDTSSLTK